MREFFFSAVGKSVQLLSHVQLFETPWTTARQASLPITNSGIYWNSCPLSQWCHPTISSSVVPFSSCLQSFPTSGFSQMSQLFTSGGQGLGVSASTSVLPVNAQNWSHLGWTGWISLQSKGLSRVFSNTTVQKLRSSTYKWYLVFVLFGLLHLVWWFLSPSMLLEVALFHYFLWLIVHHVYVCVCVSVYTHIRTHIICSLLCRWTLRLFPCLACYK